MGRTKGKHLWTAAGKLVEKFPEAFSGVFEDDKNVIRGMKLVEHSRKELNKLSAAVSGLVKRRNAKQASLEEKAPAVAA
ncbi:MAG: hypothetical protein AABW54_03890 [Candidatus Micrarchaeota archaeon]